MDMRLLFKRSLSHLERSMLRNKRGRSYFHKPGSADYIPDASVSKWKCAQVKARFCVRGDIQVQRIDFLDKFSPAVNLTTVGLMLILLVVLGLATKGVDYTASFFHAPVKKLFHCHAKGIIFSFNFRGCNICLEFTAPDDRTV